MGYQCAFFQYRHDVLAEEDWGIFRALLRSFWLLPGKEVARLWAQFKAGGFLDERFVEEVERLRDEAETYQQTLKEEGLELGRS